MIPNLDGWPKKHRKNNQGLPMYVTRFMCRHSKVQSSRFRWNHTMNVDLDAWIHFLEQEPFPCRSSLKAPKFPEISWHRKSEFLRISKSNFEEMQSKTYPKTQKKNGESFAQKNVSHHGLFPKVLAMAFGNPITYIYSFLSCSCLKTTPQPQTKNMKKNILDVVRFCWS